MAKKTIKQTIDDIVVSTEEQMYEVPSNWCWTRIGSLVEICLGLTHTPTYVDSGVPFISVKDMSSGYLDMSDTKYITKEEYDSLPYGAKPKKGDILFARVGTIGVPQVLDIDEEIGTFVSLGFFRLHHENVLREYICHWMNSIIFDEQVAKNVKGSTLKNLNTGWLKDFQIPLPPLAEQKRIVEQIENLFSKLDEAKVKAQFVVDSYDERKAAILYSAFTGKLSQSWRETNVNAASESLEAMYSKDVITDNTPCELPDNWCWVKMGALGYTNIGLTYSPSDKSDEGTIVLRSSNIQDGQMDYEDIVRVNMDIPDNKMCKKGDLLICARNGSKALVGKTAIVDKDGMSYGAFMAIFRSEYNKYIYYFMSSPFFRNLIDSDVSTTTINQVTQGIIKNLMFPLAPVKEQEYISDKLKDILDKERSARDMAVETIENIELTKKAILAKAFRGELGTNIEDEENNSKFDILD